MEFKNVMFAIYRMLFANFSFLIKINYHNFFLTCVVKVCNMQKDPVKYIRTISLNICGSCLANRLSLKESIG